MVQTQSTESPERGQSVITRFLLKFRRVTTSGNFIAEIDGLRFIAIGTVILFHLVVGLSIHAPDTFAKPSSTNIVSLIALQGFHGVELFFIISGFILAYPFASHFLKGKNKVNLRSYFLRRLTRLEPPYMICMIIFFVLLVLFKNRNIHDLFPHFVASMFYLHNAVYAAESLVNNVAWSLEIEIQFYLLVPFLSWIFAIRRTSYRRAVIIGLCFLSIILGFVLITPGDRLSLTIVRFLHFFLLGFLLADLYIIDWKESPRKQWRWDMVSFIGWPILVLVWNISAFWPTVPPVSSDSYLSQILFPLCAFFLYCAVFLGPFTNRIITNPWITTIGGMCYTIYLLHNPIMGLIMSYSKYLAPSGSYEVNIILQLFIVVPLMLIPCGLYFLAIEKPCMRKDWPQRLWARTRTYIHL